MQQLHSCFICLSNLILFHFILQSASALADNDAVLQSLRDRVPARLQSLAGRGVRCESLCQ